MIESTISLYISGAKVPELYRIVFSHPLLEEPRTSVRAKVSPVYNFTFQWTPAVQALCVLLLEEVCQETAVLSGSANSLASALDYALSKQPQWMRDVFGTDKRGRTLLRRLLSRTNPERKRPGPVLISLNPKAKVRIEVKFEGREISSVARLKTIAAEIRKNAEQRLSTRIRVSNGYPENGSEEAASEKDLPTSLRPWLEDAFKAEIKEMLRASDIFSPLRVKEKVQAIMANPSVQRVAPQAVPWISDIDLQLSSSERRGLGLGESVIRSALCRDDPIRCSVPWIVVGALALFEYLKRKKGYNLTIDFAYNYTAELRRDVVSGRVQELPDVCVHGLGPAATFMQDAFRLGYSPFMLMPQVSHRVLVPKSAQKTGVDSLADGEFTFLCEEASSPWFYFEDLKRRKMVASNTKRTKISHAEPDEIMKLLYEGNPEFRALIFFPHYVLHETYGPCKAHSTRQEVDNTESIMFTHARLNSEPHRLRCLNVALRNAWYELLENPLELEELVGDIFNTPDFLPFLSRSIGYQYAKSSRA